MQRKHPALAGCFFVGCNSNESLLYTDLHTLACDLVRISLMILMVLMKLRTFISRYTLSVKQKAYQ